MFPRPYRLGRRVIRSIGYVFSNRDAISTVQGTVERVFIEIRRDTPAPLIFRLKCSSLPARQTNLLRNASSSSVKRMLLFRRGMLVRPEREYWRVRLRRRISTVLSVNTLDKLSRTGEIIFLSFLSFFFLFLKSLILSTMCKVTKNSKGDAIIR